MTYNF